MRLQLFYYPFICAMWFCLIFMMFFALIGMGTVIEDKTLTESEEQVWLIFFSVMPIIMLVLPFYFIFFIKPKSFTEIKEGFTRWKNGFKRNAKV